MRGSVTSEPTGFAQTGAGDDPGSGCVGAGEEASSEVPGEPSAPGGWPGVAGRAAVGGALHWRSSSLMMSTLHNAPPPKLDFAWELAVSLAIIPN